MRECQDFASDKFEQGFGKSKDRPQTSSVRRLYNRTHRWAIFILIVSFPVTLLVGPWILQSPLNAFIDTIVIVMLMFLSFLLGFEV